MATIVAFHAHPGDEVLLTEAQADLLLSYDPQGGNRHRDHVRVHEVGARAAELAGVRVVEATVPREVGVRMLRLLVRSPLPVFRIALGTEWFAEPGGRTGDRV